MKISVITVCYNSARTIEHTLASVQAQKDVCLEHWIVDGGSTDGTLDILAAHRSHLAGIISEPDRGMYDAMNKGLALATGEIVGFLNADDYYAHDRVLASLGHIFSQTEVDAVYADLDYVAYDQLEKVVRRWRSQPFKPGLFAHGWCPGHPTFYVKKSIYERFGNFDIRMPLGNDVELMMRFLERHHIRAQYVPEVWVKMRMGGVSNRHWRHIWIQNKAIIQAARKHQISLSVFHFFWYKILNRVSQFWRR